MLSRLRDSHEQEKHVDVTKFKRHCEHMRSLFIALDFGGQYARSMDDFCVLFFDNFPYLENLRLS